MNVHTLDKYVKRKSTKQKYDNFIFPKQKEVNLNDPKFKNKGLNNNIINIYEDKEKENKQ
jgi:hypothetical protein